ncbi:MAG TPA: histidine kinase [Bryobacteraceae bacterium]|nr:histidine kinase [Bryobacteraceae bacterium]
MSRADWNENVAPVLIENAPLCQWGFTRSRRFLYISGMTDIFGRQPEELLHQHVSTIDDAGKSWAARLDRIFSGASTSDTVSSAADLGRVILHVPIRARDGSVAYAAGFSFSAGRPAPDVRELELAAIAILQVLRTERARTERFLHDVVAQCLSSTGLQLELLRLEIEEHERQTPSRSAEIQHALTDALRRVRMFSAGEDA